MKSKIRPIAFEILKFSFAAALLGFLFYSGRIDLQSLKTLYTPQVLGVGILSLALVFYFASERWRLLLSQQRLQATRFQAFKLTLIGNFFNFFVPGGVGGDVVKAVLIAQDHPSQRGKAVLTVLADRILGLFTMTFLALVSFSFAPELLNKEKSFQFIFAFLALLFLGFLFGFWVLLSGKTARLREQIGRLTQRIPKLHKLWVFAQTYHLHWKEWLGLIALSLGAQVTQILLFMVVASQLVPEMPSASVFFFAVPVGFMVTAVPIAPAGIGIGQAAFLYLFSKAMGTETNLGAVGITAFQAFQLLYGLLGAVFFVLLKKRNPQMSLQQMQENA